MGQTQVQTIPGATIQQGTTFSLSQWQWQLTTAEWMGQPAYLEVQILDAKGLKIYQIRSTIFQLQASTVISGNRLNSDETEYIAPHYQDRLIQVPCLPKGRYSVRAALYVSDQTVPAAQHISHFFQRQNCFFPISLVEPASQAQVCEQQPLFQWMSPTMGAGLSYQFQLFELFPHQTAQQAVVANPPLVTRRLSQASFRYDQMPVALEEGTAYAWRILALHREELIAQSPIGTFTYGCPSPITKQETPQKTKSRAASFVRAGAAKQPPHYTFEEGILRFFFVQDHPNEAIALVVQDELGNVLSQSDLETKVGHNYLTIPLQDLGLKPPPGDQVWSFLIQTEHTKQKAFTAHFLVP